MGRAASTVFISLPRFSNSRWFYHKNFQYHYLRLYGALWFMNNTLEVLHLNRGSEIEHSYETKYIWRVETVEKTRDSFVDQLKGLACFLVVFGHVIMWIRKAGISTPKSMVFVEEYIWTFHVPLFMFLSGYVYRLTGGWEAKGTRKKISFT